MDLTDEQYRLKYLKYKQKYLELKNNMEGGMTSDTVKQLGEAVQKAEAAKQLEGAQKAVPVRGQNFRAIPPLIPSKKLAPARDRSKTSIVARKVAKIAARKASEVAKKAAQTSVQGNKSDLQKVVGSSFIAPTRYSGPSMPAQKSAWGNKSAKSALLKRVGDLPKIREDISKRVREARKAKNTFKKQPVPSVPSVEGNESSTVIIDGEIRTQLAELQKQLVDVDTTITDITTRMSGGGDDVGMSGDGGDGDDGVIANDIIKTMKILTDLQQIYQDHSNSISETMKSNTYSLLKTGVTNSINDKTKVVSTQLKNYRAALASLIVKLQDYVSKGNKLIDYTTQNVGIINFNPEATEKQIRQINELEWLNQ